MRDYFEHSSTAWCAILAVLLLGLTRSLSQPALTIQVNSNDVALSFQGSRGTNHVQWIGSLGSSNWTTLTNVVLPSEQFLSITDYNITNQFARFYRVVINDHTPTNTSSIVLIDNLAGTVDGSAIEIAGGDPGFERVRVAAGFTIANNSQSGAFTFTIRASNPNNSPVFLSLVSNTGGMPSETDVFPLASTISSGGFYRFSGEGTLNAMTTYWLVASAGSSLADSFTWSNRGAYNSQHNAFAAFAGFRFEQGNGAPDDFSWGTQNNFFPGLEIVVTPQSQRLSP